MAEQVRGGGASLTGWRVLTGHVGGTSGVHDVGAAALRVRMAGGEPVRGRRARYDGRVDRRSGLGIDSASAAMASSRRTGAGAATMTGPGAARRAAARA